MQLACNYHNLQNHYIYFSYGLTILRCSFRKHNTHTMVI